MKTTAFYRGSRELDLFFSGTGSVCHGISDFRASGEIVEYDPPRLLAYTWVANWHKQPSLVTSVRWELEPAGDKTRLKVTHSGLTTDPETRKDYIGGWPGVMQYLKNFVER
jgi:uncharacterized protein YndB with AHSA1/START domain